MGGVSQGEQGRRRGSDTPSIVGSYSSTKWLWISWMVKQDLPTPPPPTTTSLYSLRNCYRVSHWGVSQRDRGSWARTLEAMMCSGR